MATAPTWTDSDLLPRLRRRDRSAWEELYRTYEKRLYGFAYRLSGNQHDAADLVQETFVRALPKLDRLPPERANIGAYLFATTKNLFLKQKERTKRAMPADEVPEPDEAGHIEEDPQRAVLLRRQQDEVRIANGKLAPRQRLVLALRELEDKSYAEIGELVGLNENAVAQLILRARQSLREELRLVQIDRSKLSDVCQGYLPLLSAHLDGQLRGAKQADTLAHLESCEDCQKALIDMEEARRRYRALVPPLVAVVALREKVDAALAANGYWDTPAGGHVIRAGLGRGGMLVATIAGLAILGSLAVGVGGVGGAGSHAAAGSVQASSPAGEASPATSEEASTSPSSPGTPQEPASSPAETTEGESGQPASGDGDPSAVSETGAGGNNQPGANGGGNGGSSQPEPDDPQSGSGSEPEATGGASGDSGGPESDGSEGGGGSSQGDTGSRADGGSQENSGSPAEDGSRGDGSQTDDGSRGDDATPESEDSRGDESPLADETSQAEEGSRGGESPPVDDGSRGDASSQDNGSQADEGARVEESSQGTDASRGDETSQAAGGSTEGEALAETAAPRKARARGPTGAPRTAKPPGLTTVPSRTTAPGERSRSPRRGLGRARGRPALRT